ncbi:MAG: TAT-variant-translocated molybdopterin oxidoreductase, partial [Candidatus Binatia bacterium]
RPATNLVLHLSPMNDPGNDGRRQALMDERSLDLSSIRERLRDARGPRYWRSLEEVAGTPAFRELLEREFPAGASEWLDPVSRRRFLQLMGASLALAGVSACTRQPKEAIVPYVQQPEEIVPGRPLFFATATLLGGYATGILVESHEGRPTKVEGNPLHPASLGATDLFGQASILGLYDPDRSQVLTDRGRIRTWQSFLRDITPALAAQKAAEGAGLRVLTGAVTSPTLAAQLRALLERYPKAKWHQHEPAGRDGARAGAILAFDEDVSVRYHVSRADVILSLDADLLASGAAHLRYAREFSVRRRVSPDAEEMSRLYVIESSPSSTGAIADHRLPLRAGDVEAFARVAAAKLGIGVEPPTGDGPVGRHGEWIEALVRDLRRHPGSSLVVAGDRQPPIVHALAHAMNERLGNVGKTVVYARPVEAEPVDTSRSLLELVDDMDNGRVELLFVLGANPVYDAPADVEFARRMEKVRLRVRLGLYEDETSASSHWHVPEAHPLETWSDARAYDGTATILQPLIEPLYDGKSAHEVLAVLLGRLDESAYELVRETWKRQGVTEFDRAWRRWLHDGLVEGTELPPKAVSLRSGWTAVASMQAARSPLEIVFRPDSTVHDGRFANNGWLQEMPKPLTKLTWDNVAAVSPRTAERLGLGSGEVVEIRLDGRSIGAPVWIQPGHADDSVTVTLGYGRARVGRIGDGLGFNAYRIRTSDEPWIGTAVDLRKTGDRHALAATQEHHSMEGRQLVRSASLEHYREHPDFAQHVEHVPPPDMTLYPPHDYSGHAWGMAIDLNACIGCGVCELACQAENNIPVVG